MKESTTRRRFLAAGPAAMALAVLNGIRPRGVAGATPTFECQHDHHHHGGGVLEHPEPRAGIDASLVLSHEELEPFGTEAQEVFALVREMPELLDGIACYCGCDQLPNYRSLLTCFYEEGMARGCQICQGEARLAHRRWKEGQSLDQIRRAIDARYG